MANKEILAECVTRWVRPMLKQVVGGRLSQNATFANVENVVRKWFPVSASYSLMNDIDFALNAIAGAKVRNAVCGFVDTLGIGDADIPCVAREFVTDWLNKCDANGGAVTLFEHVTFERKDIEELQRFIEASFV